MNVAKHMEFIFIGATVLLCSLAWQPEAISNTEVSANAVQNAAASTQASVQQAEVQTIVITGKRG